MHANITELNKRVAAGLVTMRSKGSLTLYNYNEKCQFERAWDEFTLMARGLIVDASGEVVALPFYKFFNLGESDCPPLPNEPYSLFEKVDGSLGIWYWWAGEWRVATRGSFENDFTDYARQYAHYLKSYRPTTTILSEIVMPEELDRLPRAVRHEPGIYLLGGRNIETGYDIPIELLSGGWSGPRARRDEITINDALARAESTTGTEGWVVRFESGLRVKIKTAWYLRLFRAISDLSEKRIKELMEPDITSGNWLADFPEELRDEATAIRASILARHTDYCASVQADYLRKFNPDRKTFALSVKDDPYRALLFKLYDGRDISKMVLEVC